MLYQLPNGKTVYMTIEEYLGLSDDEFKSVLAVKPCSEPSYNMFFESSKEIKVKPQDKSIDFNPNEDSFYQKPFNINDLSEDQFE